MKDFRKNKQGLYICEECGKIYKCIQSLSTHISKLHNNQKYYYDKWIKESSDSICKICRKETEFTNRLNLGYKNCCSKECGNKYTYQQIEKAKFKYHLNKYYNNHKKSKQTCLKNYGVEYPIQSKKIIKKIKSTNNKKYGCDNVFQSNIVKEKIKETCLEKYGAVHNLSSKKIRKQIKQTKLKLYGNENYTNRKKSKQTCLKHYGVEYPLQNREIFEKAQKTRFLRKQFRDTKIWYQGSYELDFLEKYYDKYPDITRGPRIKYIFEDKEHYYFSDFLILSKNLVVECKNSYLAKKDKLVLKEKKKATKKQDFKWIMIIDKNYSKFELQL